MRSLKLMIFYGLCMLATASLAQEQRAERATDFNRYADGQYSSRTVAHDWIRNLESAGIVNRSLPAPYRLAVPLAEIDNSGTVLSATYAAMPGATGGRGLLLFVRIPLR